MYIAHKSAQTIAIHSIGYLISVDFIYLTTFCDILHTWNLFKHMQFAVVPSSLDFQANYLYILLDTGF